MNYNWEKEGLKFLENILGEDISFEELENNLEENSNKELSISFFKNLINFLGISAKIGEDLEQNVRLDVTPKKFLKKYLKTIFQFSKNNPDIVQQLEDVGKNFAEIFQSVDFHKELLSFSTGNEFEDLLKKRFLEELDRAELISKNAVVKSFKIALNYIVRQQQPDQLFILSSYNKLGVQPEKLKTDTILNLITSIIEIIFTKKQEIFKLSDDELVDYLNEFVSRLGRAIEPYLKVIIVSIYNLQKIYQKGKFDDFEKGFGYYLSSRRSLHIQHSENEDYIDYRNAINHINGFDVFFNRKSEEITMKFYLKRETKGRVNWNKTVEMGLKEFEKLFRDFRKFQNSFFYFYEVYIKSIDKNYQYQFLPFKDFFN